MRLVVPMVAARSADRTRNGPQRLTEGAGARRAPALTMHTKVETDG
ncbi:hypothetical protein ACFVQ3_10355 [Oerskovia sp. NPDC057915]